MTLTQAIQDEALRLGFSLVGVTTPASPPHYAVFERWLQSGRHAGMAYLENPATLPRRAHPQQILPECHSIMVLGLRYSPSWDEAASISSSGSMNGESGESKPYRGSIAAYAWGDDYHTIIPARLKSLVEFIESQIGKPVHNCMYTDSGPVMERDLAQRAGLGWVGKNTNLIHPRLGSYLFLAEILLELDLEFSPPFEPDRCGTCQRCLEACPTGCILPDRTLDASRCIAYLTIENKGAIPVALRRKIGDWVFGCDVCQQVCPWNCRADDVGVDETFMPRPGIAHPDLIEMLSLTPESFTQYFRGSPVKRAKYVGFLRNAAVALGNQLTEYPSHRNRNAAIAILSSVLQTHPEVLVRSHAAWALGRAGERDILRQAERLETDTTVLEEIQSAKIMPG